MCTNVYACFKWKLNLAANLPAWTSLKAIIRYIDITLCTKVILLLISLANWTSLKEIRKLNCRGMWLVCQSHSDSSDEGSNIKVTLLPRGCGTFERSICIIRIFLLLRFINQFSFQTLALIWPNSLKRKKGRNLTKNDNHCKYQLEKQENLYCFNVKSLNWN